MYRDYYRLKSKPFPSNPNVEYFWFGKKYRQLLDDLKNDLLSNKGLLSLTGDVGVGKTTIVNALSKLLEDSCIIAKVCHTTLDELDFFNGVGLVFEMKEDFDNFHSIFGKFKDGDIESPEDNND